MTTIGFSGLGMMGGPMAADLVKAGHTVVGHHRSRRGWRSHARWGPMPSSTPPASGSSTSCGTAPQGAAPTWWSRLRGTTPCARTPWRWSAARASSALSGSPSGTARTRSRCSPPTAGRSASGSRRAPRANPGCGPSVTPSTTSGSAR
nr:NAD(P)-binding domain-containing protein [Cellulomonas aerilata]